MPMLVAIDTETHLITATDKRPPMVSVATADGGAPRLWSASVDRKRLQGILRELLEDDDVTLVGHNLAYDLEVIRQWDPSLTAAIFAKYDAGLVWCTQVAEQLLAIADGVRSSRSFKLADVTREYGGAPKDEDPEGWRLRFAELDGVPVNKWPAAASKYALADADATRQLAVRQMAVCESTVKAWTVWDGKPVLRSWRKVNTREAHNQFRYAYALHLMACTGVGVDADRVSQLAEDVTGQIADMRTKLLESGLVRDNPKNKSGLSRNLKDIRARVAAAFDGDPPLTAAGNVETNRRTLLATKDPDLMRLADFSKPEKLLAFLKTLQQAVEDGGRFCPRWNVLVDTGRTSCGSKDSPGNLQNQPREGGVRECFVPREGNVFCANDYGTAELRSLAQVQLQWFGESEMAKVLQAGADLHQELANSVDWLDRQGAKAINFGAPGGLGAATLADYAEASYGVQLDDQQAQAALHAFLDRWPEMRRYFDAIAHMTRTEPTRIKQQWSSRLRGGLKYTNTANTFFQGLTADGAKRALWLVTKASYLGDMPGCLPVLFEHDELIVEGPEETAHVWAKTMDELMVEGMRACTPDIPVVTEPALMRRWYKGAKPVSDDEGNLTLWTPN
jgi:DNA polymerase-1